MGERQLARIGGVEADGAKLSGSFAAAKWLAKPRRAGVLWLYLLVPLLSASIIIRDQMEPSRPVSGDPFITFVSLTAATAAVSTALALALLMKPREWTRPVYIAAGLCWHLLAVFVLTLAATTIADEIRGEIVSFSAPTMTIAAVSVLIIALAMNRCCYEVSGGENPAGEAVAFIVGTHALLMLVLLALTYGSGLGRYSALVNEVLLAGVTGLTVLGIPTSLIVLVVLTRDSIRAGASEMPPVIEAASSTHVAHGRPSEPVIAPGLLVAVLIAVLFARRR